MTQFRCKFRDVLGLIVLGVFVSGGCGTTETAEKKDEVVSIPDEYEQTPVDGIELDRWCSDFDSPRLEKFVDKAFAQNLNLRSTWARLRQAKASARQARANRFPSLNANGSASRRQMLLPSFGGPGQGGGGGSQSLEIDEFRTSLAASYELDLYGKIANRHRAAQYDALAARADAEAMVMSMASQVANQWFELIFRRRQVDLLKQQISTSEQYLQLTQMKFSRGQSTALNVNQQRQQIEGLKSQLERARAQRILAETKLAVLLGKTPQSDLDVEVAEFPRLPTIPDPGIPADLLEQRPDVRAAEKRLMAADRRVLAAIKDRLPTISLSASLFYQADSIKGLFEDLLKSASGKIGLPIFQGGAISAREDQARAVLQQRLYDYGQTLLEALKDVRDALVREKSQKEVVRRLRKQEKMARKNLELSRNRYQQGAVSYLRVLDSLRSLQDIERQRLEAERAQFGNRIQLCRAIGGSWTKKVENPLAKNN